jgi:hypothetical protein
MVVHRCYALNLVGAWSRSRSGVCVKSDLASAYVLHLYVTICPNISECCSLGRRQTRTRDSDEIQYSNWGISPQLAGLNYKCGVLKGECTPKVTKPEGGSGSGSTDVRRTADPESDIRVGLSGAGESA